MFDPALLDLFQRLAMALGLGFLLGVERGWRHRDAPDESRAAGLRTHAVIGLLGGLCAALTPVVGQVGFAALALCFGAALIVFKVRESQRDGDLSVTGTLAAFTVFVLGAYCIHGDLRIAAAAGVGLVGLMAFKQALHDWIDTLTWPELRSAFLVLAATAIALPILPDRAIDPWGAIHPRELWLLTILVAGVSFAGYVAVRVLGARIGVLAGAAAGALASSTAVTGELGRRAKAGEISHSMAAAGACLAAAVSIGRVGVFVAAIAPAVFPAAAPALMGAVLAFGVAAWALAGRAPRGVAGAGPLRSPLDIAAVARFAALLGAVIAIGRWASDAFGQAGLLSFAVLAGAADVDAVALAAASLVRAGMAPGAGAEAILVGVLVNTFAKAGIAALAGGRRYGGLYLACALGAGLAAAAAWFLARLWLAPMSQSLASPGGVFLG